MIHENPSTPIHHKPHRSPRRQRFLKNLQTSTSVAAAARDAGYKRSYSNPYYNKLLDACGFSPENLMAVRAETILRLRERAEEFLRQTDNTNYLRAEELVSKILGLCRDVALIVSVDGDDQRILDKYGICNEQEKDIKKQVPVLIQKG